MVHPGKVNMRIDPQEAQRAALDSGAMSFCSMTTLHLGKTIAQRSKISGRRIFILVAAGIY
jgi:hypothetical protein